MSEEQPKKIIKVRLARPADAVAVFRLLEEAYSDAESAYPALNEGKLMVWVAETIANHEVWVADLSGRVVGSIALGPFLFPWSEEWVLHGRWIYVLKKFRARGTGKMMIRAARESAREKGAKLVIGTQATRDANWKDDFIGSFPDMNYGGGTFFWDPGGES